MTALELALHGILARVNVAFCRALMREWQLLNRASMWSMRLSEWQHVKLDAITARDAFSHKR